MNLQYAMRLLAGLADGVDPLTGELLPEDSVCNQAEIVRALHCVLSELRTRQEKPAQPTNAGKPWTPEDDAELARMYRSGCSRKQMRERFQRSNGALDSRLARLGLTADAQRLPEPPREG